MEKNKFIVNFLLKEVILKYLFCYILSVITLSVPLIFKINDPWNSWLISFSASIFSLPVIFVIYPTAYTVPPATTQLSSSTFIKKYNIQLIRPESSHAPQLTSYATAYSPPQLDSASLHLAVCCRQVLPLRNTAPSS